MAGLLPPEADVGALRAPMRSCLVVLGLFVILLAAFGLLERLGIGAGTLPLVVVVVAAGLSLAVALLSHGRRAADFYAADGLVVARLAGVASAGSLAGLLLIGGLGAASQSGPGLAAVVTGVCFGALLCGISIAPRLRRAGGYSAADFFAGRFGRAAGFAAAVIAFVASMLVFVACLKLCGSLVVAVTGATPGNAIIGAGLLSALVLVPGGLRSLTWTQVFQYFVAALACLAPAAILAAQGSISVTPGVAEGLVAAVGSVGEWSPQTVASVTPPFLLFAAGTLTFPPLLQRACTAPSAAQASSSTLWALLFAIVLGGSGLVLADGLAVAAGFPTVGMDMLSWSMALFSALPSVLAGLVVAGIAAALLSLGQATLFAASSSLSRNVWQAVAVRRGREGRRIFAARLVVLAVAAGGVTAAVQTEIEAPALLDWAFAAAVAGSLAPLVAGLYWRRCCPAGAFWGMIVGFAVIGLTLCVELGLLPDWAALRAVPPAVAALIGLAASAIVTVGASLIEPAPTGGGSAPLGRGARIRPADI